MKYNVERVLISESEIAQKVDELGKILTEKYMDKHPIFVCPLKGSMIFFADLLRKIKTRCEVDFMVVSSYKSNMVSSGNVKILKDLNCDISGRNVIIVEDIIDSGYTLSRIKNLLENRCPESLEICTLLDKPSGRVVPIEPDYCGFTIPDFFVVGYGMDLNEEYRNLPYIGIYKAIASN